MQACSHKICYSNWDTQTWSKSHNALSNVQRLSKTNREKKCFGGQTNSELGLAPRRTTIPPGGSRTATGHQHAATPTSAARTAGTPAPAPLRLGNRSRIPGSPRPPPPARRAWARTRRPTAGAPWSAAGARTRRVSPGGSGASRSVAPGTAAGPWSGGCRTARARSAAGGRGTVAGNSAPGGGRQTQAQTVALVPSQTGCAALTASRC
mmetsp:Transcript_96555/g.258169  ORF Transcript_96555/g.258169 Transcript_96555/m.258169 type:complete len:208 (-) Transcript_96555:565-1188(-)